MNAVRIAILVAAAIAAIAVAFFVRQAMTVPAAPAAVVVEQRPVTRILAARRDMMIGERASAGDFYWQTWPEEAMSPGYIVENQGQGIEDFAGSVVRAPIGEGEPITGRRLVQSGDAGFMAAVLAPGMRAVAVPISAERGAGGFILPNDRVDVIVSFEEDVQGQRGSRRAYVARTIVENARVLAIDQAFGGDNGSENVVGETATLELTPEQARTVSLAISRGDITLVLRSLLDNEGGPVLLSGGDSETAGDSDSSNSRQSVVTLIRYGHSQTIALADND